MPIKTLVFTGGGTAGHVMPNLALAPHLLKHGWSLHYVGSNTGPENDLVTKAGIPFYSIATGKLRRYFSLKNFTDPFRVLLGAVQAFVYLGRLKPDVVFSKGGFVAVPVVLAAAMRGIPVILHESDLTPGLANRICLPFCKRVCVSFPETLDYVPITKAILTGTPIRNELLLGDKIHGLKWLGFSNEKPILLIMGGSSGSSALNSMVRNSLTLLNERWNVVHLCGPGHGDERFDKTLGYRQFEFVNAELSHVIAAASLVVTRGGANALFEFMALRKPCLIIPLPSLASRGDQILNANSFVSRKMAHLLLQENLNSESFIPALLHLEKDVEHLQQTMEHSDLLHGTEKVLDIIESIRKT